MRLLTTTIIVLVVAVNVAYAKCRPDILSEQNRVDRASAIFIAEVTSAKLVTAPEGGEDIEAKYRLLETLKGTPEKRGTVSSFHGVPGIQLTPGETYLFFEYGTDEVDFCGGSQRLLLYGDPSDNREREFIDHLRRMINKLPNMTLNLTVLRFATGGRLA